MACAPTTCPYGAVVPVMPPPLHLHGDAPQADIDYVRARLGPGGDAVIGVWKPDPESVRNAAFAPLRSMAICPCFWPVLILFGPCLYCSIVNAEARLLHSLYFATQQGFGTAMRDLPPRAGLCVVSGTGHDYSFAPWHDVQQVGVDNVGPSCCRGWQASAVMITQSGFSVRGSGGNQRVHQNGQIWYVKNPDEVAMVVRGKMQETHLGGGGAAMPVVGQPVPLAPAPPLRMGTPSLLRIFVAFARNPTDRRVVMVDAAASMDALRAAVGQVFNLVLDPQAQLQIHAPNGSLSTFTSASMLAHNDVILIS